MTITFKEFGTEEIENSLGDVVRTQRTATLTVEHDDGSTEDVTRSIPDVFAGSIQDYLKALADGLRAEFAPKEVTPIEEDALDGLVL